MGLLCSGYSVTPPHDTVFVINVRPDIMMWVFIKYDGCRAPIDGLCSGASALSPSGRLLAIANLSDGIDWYSIKERIYLSSTTYEAFDEHAYVPGIDFVDERTVVVGACRGQIKFATHGRGMNPPGFTLRGATEGTHSINQCVFLISLCTSCNLDIQAVVGAFTFATRISCSSSAIASRVQATATEACALRLPMPAQTNLIENKMSI